jgi:hypothetical protein
LSISALARAAGVSRSNLYASHSDLIASLRQSPRKMDLVNEQNDRTLQLQQVRDENLQLKRSNKALLLLNIELRQELSRLARRSPAK